VAGTYQWIDSKELARGRGRTGGILSDEWYPGLGMLAYIGDPQTEFVADLDHFPFRYFLAFDL
jgi:hypothetical protein